MRRLGIVAVGLGLVVAVGALAGLSVARPDPAAAQPWGEMQIVGPAGPVPVGDTFDANITIRSGPLAICAYMVEVDVPAGLSFVSGAHQSGTFPLCNLFGWFENESRSGWWNTDCHHNTPCASFTGLVETVTLHCDSPGTYPLDLVSWEEDGGGYYGSVVVGSDIYYPTLIGDTVTCGSAVGGVAELPGIDGAPLQTSGSSSPSAGVLAAMAAALAAGAITLGGAAWYVRRRRLR